MVVGLCILEGVKKRRGGRRRIRYICILEGGEGEEGEVDGFGFGLGLELGLDLTVYLFIGRFVLGRKGFVVYK